jgi:uncharacterized protein YqhQ
MFKENKNLLNQPFINGFEKNLSNCHECMRIERQRKSMVKLNEKNKNEAKKITKKSKKSMFLLVFSTIISYTMTISGIFIVINDYSCNYIDCLEKENNICNVFFYLFFVFDIFSCFTLYPSLIFDIYLFRSIDSMLILIILKFPLYIMYFIREYNLVSCAKL